MKKGISRSEITQSSQRGTASLSRASRRGQSVSLPIGQVSTLNAVHEHLVFDHRIKESTLSSVVELALQQLFSSQSAQEIANLIADDVRKMHR